MRSGGYWSLYGGQGIEPLGSHSLKEKKLTKKKLKYFLIQLHFFLLSKSSETSKKSILGSDPFLRGGLRDGQVKRADYFEAELIF